MMQISMLKNKNKKNNNKITKTHMTKAVNNPEGFI